MNQDSLDRVFNLLLQINGNMNQKIDLQAKELGYNTSEYLVLLDILTHQGTSQNQVCERLGLKKSAVSKLLNKLEVKREISRKQCPEDRREVKLYVEDQHLLDTLCKTTMLNRAFTNFQQFSCNVDDIEASLIDVKKMLSD